MSKHQTQPDNPRADRAAEVHDCDTAALAYQLWLQRGSPAGSPDDDWFRAETLLREGLAGASISTSA
jgi:hypothetical protein